MSAEMVRDTIAFSATDEPRLMSAMRIPKPNETQRALRGMFQPGRTCSILVSIGSSGEAVAYSSEIFGEWETIVSRERPDLARRCGDLADDGHDQGDDDDGGHDGRCNIATRNIVEQLEEGKSRAAVEKPGDVRHGKAEGENAEIAENSIEPSAP